jgi:hypothetical protein
MTDAKMKGLLAAHRPSCAACRAFAQAGVALLVVAEPLLLASPPRRRRTRWARRR